MPDELILIVNFKYDSHLFFIQASSVSLHSNMETWEQIMEMREVAFMCFD